MEAGALEARRIAYAAVFTALVFAATLVSVSVPATEGYFNLGESMVYAAAVLGGPWVGAVAGGLGSALADVYLGYGKYAPGTLVIKGVEGALAGWLYSRLSRLVARAGPRAALAAAGVAAAGILAAGALVYGGLYGGPTVLEVWGRSVEVRVPAWAWAAVALLVGAAVYAMARRLEPGLAAAPAAMLLAGMEMVAGYFAYEAVVLGYGITAAAEIPVNIAQSLIGAAVATTIASTAWRAGWRGLERPGGPSA